jgi:hypothetical protein
MVTYSPRCTYEIRSFPDRVFFWDFTRYVIVKINPRYTKDMSYHKQFFNSVHIDYDAICWGDFDQATKYFSYTKAFGDLNRILNSNGIENMTLEYSTNDYESHEDPLEKKFAELENVKNT